MSASPPVLHQRNLPLLLLQVRERVIGRFRPMLNEAGLTEQQWRVLRALLGHGPLEPRQIGEVCCLSSASLVGILARMEDLGLISRQRVAADQRRLLVSPSTQGKHLAQRLAPHIDAIYAQLELDLGQAAYAQLYRTLDSVLSKI